MDFLKEIRSLSRAGKQTTDKYLILKDKDIILSGNIKRKPNYIKKPNQTEKDQLVHENQISTPSKPKGASHSSKSSISSPSFKTQDRISYYKSRSIKDPHPPPGHYEPNFEAIKKYIGSPVFSRPQTQRKKLVANSPKPNKNDNFISKDHQIKKADSIADTKWMSIQKPTPSSNFNESTILALNLSPIASTSAKALSALDFRKQTGRKPLFKSMEFHQDYKPNKDICMPKQRVLDMNKNLSRNDFYKECQTPDPYDVNYKLVTKKLVSFDFSKTTPRNKLRKASLPDFMKGPLGWMSLDLISSDSFIFDRINTCRPFIYENY
ncbi:unnamed protein product [Blepharisma stoltei]|uniref:Uncharacterized protein n=1 Tax=Blepharisma stoltei TaxID=1481888 RepID=A0AAU9JBT1_9CILI|nr:unnamed protein product [Blepharisma stoltei]